MVWAGGRLKEWAQGRGGKGKIRAGDWVALLSAAPIGHAFQPTGMTGGKGARVPAGNASLQCTEPVPSPCQAESTGWITGCREPELACRLQVPHPCTRS